MKKDKTTQTITKPLNSAWEHCFETITGLVDTINAAEKAGIKHSHQIALLREAFKSAVRAGAIIDVIREELDEH